MDRKYKPPKKFTIDELKEMRETYKKKTEELLDKQFIFKLNLSTP